LRRHIRSEVLNRRATGAAQTAQIDTLVKREASGEKIIEQNGAKTAQFHFLMAKGVLSEKDAPRSIWGGFYRGFGRSPRLWRNVVGSGTSTGPSTGDFLPKTQSSWISQLREEIFLRC